MPLKITVPDVELVELVDSTGKVIATEEAHVIVDLLRKSQEGVDTSDPLQTQVWTGRFAVNLNDVYGTPTSKPISSAQAYLIADAVNGYWSKVVKSFREGLK